MTLSFWFRSNAPAGSQFTYSLLCFTPGTPSWAGTFVPIPGVWQYWTFTVPPPPNGSSWSTGTTGALAVYVAPYYPGGFTTTVNAWNSGSFTYCAYGSYNWPGLAGNFIHCTGVQLEKGTVATPFEFRNYAQELALCQRYFTKLGGTTGLEFLGSGIAASTTQANILCITPVPMRDISATTINVLNVGNIRLLGSLSGLWNAIVTTAIIRDSAGTNGITVQATVGSASLTLGYPYFLQNTNSTGGVIQINNEL